VVITEYLYWGMIECGVGIIAACVPTFFVLDAEPLQPDQSVLPDWPAGSPRTRGGEDGDSHVDEAV